MRFCHPPAYIEGRFSTLMHTAYSKFPPFGMQHEQVPGGRGALGYAIFGVTKTSMNASAELKVVRARENQSSALSAPARLQQTALNISKKLRDTLRASAPKPSASMEGCNRGFVGLLSTLHAGPRSRL